MVQPILEYASVIWSPYYTTLIEQLESIQHHSAHFIFNDYNHYSSVTNMLVELGWSTLRQQRTKCCAIMMFKIINHMIDIPPRPPIFITNDRSTRWYHHKFIQLSTRINSYLNSFFPDAIRIWNSLPLPLIEYTTIDKFKQQL